MLDTTDHEGYERELARVAEARREHQHLHVQREAAVAEVEAAVAEVDVRRATLVREHEDVTALASMSITRVMTSLRGERDDALRREVAEREAARLAFLAAEERQRAALVDLATIDDRLAALGDVDAEWKRVVDARERWLEVTSEAGAEETTPTSGGATAVAPDDARLTSLIERRGVLEAEVREVDEALAAAHLAAARLAHAASVLGSTHGAGSGRLEGERLDEAGAMLRHVDLALATLRRELADVARTGVPTFGADRWDRTFETFCDDLFTEDPVDRRMGAAAAQVVQLRSEVDTLLEELRALARALVTEAESLDETRRQPLD